MGCGGHYLTYEASSVLVVVGVYVYVGQISDIICKFFTFPC